LNTKNKWIYKSTEDSQYIKDKDNMLRKNGNGWWIYNDRKLSKNKGFKKGEEWKEKVELGNVQDVDLIILKNKITLKKLMSYWKIET